MVMKKQIRCIMRNEKIDVDWLRVVLSWWIGIELKEISHGGGGGSWWMYEFVCDWDLDFEMFKVELLNC